MKKNENLYRTPHGVERKHGEINSEPSKTRPNGSLSLKQLFAMHRRGQIVQPTMATIDDPDFINYMCEMEDKDLTQLDKIRQRAGELYKRRESELSELQNKVKAEDVVPLTE